MSTYSSEFPNNDFKVALWQNILADVPYELAEKNLLAYIRNPDNRFPPHPGALAERPVQAAEGPYIPNVEETRAMLDEIYAVTPAPPTQGFLEMKARLLGDGR